MQKLVLVTCVWCLPLWPTPALTSAAGPPPTRERPTSQPADRSLPAEERQGNQQDRVEHALDDLSPAEKQADHSRTTDRWSEAERQDLEFRIRTLERTVEELTRQVGGPRRDLTLRPEASLDTLLDRFERDLRRLEQRVDRLEVRLDALQRDLDRISRRLRV